ncbi:MAG: DNA helicase PcrA [bacterium]|nr:DNA helicase PcrA [bacterium]
MSWLNALNDAQKKAVTHPEGPLLVLAGAGSGKTRVLTYRVVWLIREMGVDPRSVMALTFTNKAAGEMKSRIEELTGRRDIWAGTLHSTCSRMLRQDWEKLGGDPRFTIYDGSDQLVLMRSIMKELNIDDKQHTPQAVIHQISQAKNELITADKYRPAGYFQEVVARIYKRYQAALINQNAMDFDDLILNAVRLLQEDPDTARYYAERFRHILVDEYQDINLAQYTLIKLLAQPHRCLTAVGDDDQSIYGWRGADVSIILRFEKDFPEAGIVKLEQNYRSTGNILAAAHAVISHNSGRHAKKLWTENEDGTELVLYQAMNEEDEAFFTAREITRLVEDDGRSLSDFAVLYRTNAQSRAMEEALVRLDIPYVIVGGLRFYERKEIKDIMAYLRVVENPADAVSLRRIINVPGRGVGPASLTRLEHLAEAEGIPLLEAVGRTTDIEGLSRKAAAALQELYSLLSGLGSRRENMPVGDIIAEVLERSGYMRMLQDENTIEAEGRLENIKELLTVAREFIIDGERGTLAAFLEQVALVADIDSLPEETSVVTLMTLHSAKGLEFPVVFMVGMEEGLFPHNRSLLDTSEMEEERRLCYVGLTRAREQLYLTHAWRRMIYGSVTGNRPSRFLDDIPSDMMRRQGTGSDYMFSETPVHGSFGPDHGRRAGASASGGRPSASVVRAPRRPEPYSDAAYRTGDKVRHAKWGDGIVVATIGGGERLKISVAFQEVGIKQLMASMAPLEKLEG